MALLLHFNAQNLESKLNKFVDLLIEWGSLVKEHSENGKNNRSPAFIEIGSSITERLSENTKEQHKLFSGGNIFKHFQLEIVPEEWHKHTDYTYLVHKDRKRIKVIRNYDRTEENQTVSEILA